MKKIEHLLQQAEKRENIAVDPVFKKQLKERIISHTRTISTGENPYYFWKRLSIIFLPVVVSLALFFSLYQGEQLFPPPAQKIARESMEEETKQEAMLFSNRSKDISEEMLQAPVPVSKEEDSLGEGSGQEIALTYELPAPTTNNSDTFLLLSGGGIIISMLLLGGILWYIHKRRK